MSASRTSSVYPRGMDVYELHRLLLNLIRLGTITAVDHPRARCRVVTGELMTDWLAWTTFSAGTTCTWQPPTVGEQVVLLCPGGDLAAGIVVRGLYSKAAKAPSDRPTAHLIRYADGATLEYDHGPHTLSAQLPSGGIVHLSAPESITLQSATVVIDTQDMICTGRLTVKGRLSYEGGLQGQGGTAQIEGEIRASGDVTAGGISLQHHQHSGVKSGGDLTGGPQ